MAAPINPWLWHGGCGVPQQEQARERGAGWHLRAKRSDGVAVGSSWVPQVLSLAD